MESGIKDYVFQVYPEVGVPAEYASLGQTFWGNGQNWHEETNGNQTRNMTLLQVDIEHWKS